MTFKHDRLSASGSAEDTQAIMVGTTTEPTMKPMSIDNDGNDNDGGVVEGVEWEKGQMQPPAYRDKWFAVVFFLQLFAVTIVAFAVGIPQLEQIGAAPNDFAKHDGDDLIDNGSSGSSSSGDGSAGIAVLMFIGVSALAAIGLSGLSLFLMNRFSESCVKVAFVASPVVFVLFGLILLSSNDAVQQSFAGVWFFIALISVLYAYCYWSHIPFASANLKTALSAVGAHYGVVSVSFLVALLGSVYSIVWWVAVGGVILAEPSECQVANDDVAARQQQADDCQNDFTNIYFFMLLLSYYWTHYTLQGITRVTVAGTVGTWWFEPEGRASCCSNTVRDSLARSVTYSFGSICLGSLIVAIVQTLKQSARNQRNRSGGSLLLCVVECLLACLRDILQYINDWAFVYVGLYGYGFIDSAKNVFNLFRSRGWTTVVANSLVVRTLILVNLMVGALTGVISLVVGYAAFGVFHVLFYGVGVVFGIVLASITLTVVDGAVKTSIVCFAEAPREFEVNHPELYHTMTSAYEERYPTVFAGIGTPDTSGGMGVGGGRSVPAATAVPLT